MPKTTLRVDDWLIALAHPGKEALIALRAVVQQATPQLVESIKWNAPSFALGDRHLLTFNTSHKTMIRLVFHAGIRSDGTPLQVADPAGLLTWAAPDRAVASWSTSAEAERDAPALAALVQAWLAAVA